jgi:Fe-S-cluster containining protein
MEYNLPQLKILAKQAASANKKLLANLKKYKAKEIDDVFHHFHEIAFEKIDCLDCANCCKSISPIVTDNDINRIAKYLKIKPSQLTENHLHLDHENDWVFNNAPCPFLDSENYCSIYDVRPKACAEYPHTDRKKMEQLFDLTIKNTEVCPAVFQILEKIKEKYSFKH